MFSRIRIVSKIRKMYKFTCLLTAVETTKSQGKLIIARGSGEQ